MAYNFNTSTSSNSSSESLSTYAQRNVSTSSASNLSSLSSRVASAHSPSLGFATLTRPRAGTMPSLVIGSADLQHGSVGLGANLGPLSSTRPDAVRRQQSSQNTLSPHQNSPAHSAFASQQQNRGSVYPSSSQPSSARISPNSSRVPSPIVPTDGGVFPSTSQHPASRNGIGHIQGAANAGSNNNNRIRSGSLTLQLPSASVADAFGPGVFSGAWTPSLEEVKSNPANADPTSPGGSSATGGDDTRHSSNSQYAAKRTLNYLGLDEPHSPNGQANVIVSPGQENGALKRATSIEGQLYALPRNSSPSTRLRASTMGTSSGENSQQQLQSLNAAGMRRRQSAAHLLTLSSLPEASQSDMESSFIDDVDQMSLHDGGHRPNGSGSDRILYSNSYENVQSAQDHRFHGSASRPRASTSAVAPGMSFTLLNSRPRAGTMAVPLRGDQHERNNSDQYAHQEIYSEQSINATPGSNQHAASAATQVPCRSLWIGNIPRHVTASDLSSVFSMYGSIESVRMLVEKMCAFVNFTSTESAVQAKDDILNRQQGQLFGSVVRIGFGKVDASPTAATGMSAPIHGTSSPSGSPESTLQSSPTRALWIGSVPGNTTPSELSSLFSPFGGIESARVLAHKNCGFVNMHRLEDAVLARKALAGREIFGSELGPIKIGYAKVPAKPGNLEDTAQPVGTELQTSILHSQTRPSYSLASAPPAPQAAGHLLQAAMGMSPGLTAGPGVARTPSPLPDPAAIRDAMLELSGDNDHDTMGHIKSVLSGQAPVAYHTNMPVPMLLSDYNEVHRIPGLEPPALRELRKRLDSGLLTGQEYDSIAIDLLEHCAMLASDYIGNNIIQRLYEKSSLPVKMSMLDRVGPLLAAIGCHKNGTWAAQKIIDCATTQEEAGLICFHLQPYVPLLLLDQFGNYVVQCTLRFGSPLTDPFFDAIVNRCWDIAQGRFGARSVRTVLENKHTPRLQQKRVALAILSNASALATNINGTLLMAWLLDTSGFPGRYKMLLAGLVPQLAYHCTHKIASTTVLKIINQSVDPQTSEAALQYIFGGSENAQDLSNNSVLLSIIGDQAHGLTFIHKLLASPSLDHNQKLGMADKIQAIISAEKLDNVPALERLLTDIDSGNIFMPTIQPAVSNSSPYNPRGKSMYSSGSPNGQVNSQRSSPHHQNQNGWPSPKMNVNLPPYNSPNHMASPQSYYQPFQHRHPNHSNQPYQSYDSNHRFGSPMQHSMSNGINFQPNVPTLQQQVRQHFYNQQQMHHMYPQQQQHFGSPLQHVSRTPPYLPSQ